MPKTLSLLLILLTVLSTGLASAQESPAPDTTGAGDAVVTRVDTATVSPVVPSGATGGALIFPGDSVQVTIWKEADLSGKFQVDENGILTLPMLGPRSVTRTTAEQLRAQLVRDYSTQLNNPSVEVSVRRRVSVLGQVQNPGLYSVDPTMQLGDVVALAGGLAEDGTTKNIDVMRGNTVLYDNVDASTPAVPNLRSGDMLVVNKKPWLSRNGKEVLGFGLAAATLIARFTIWGN